ncbi:MAG TPA: hypothetical protein VEC35_22510 [Noviherbaspirillum sp.]|nr:hypothetical protein [Noviherbaspirillum sp.]
MRKTTSRETMPDELAIAIALVWGHLNAGQMEDAAQLARGCLGIWPQEKRLAVMAAYAAVELGEPLDAQTVSLLNEAGCEEWARLVIRRAEERTR